MKSNKKKELSNSNIIVLVITLVISGVILTTLINEIISLLNYECDGFDCIGKLIMPPIFILILILTLIPFMTSFIVLLKSGISSLLKNDKKRNR